MKVKEEPATTASSNTSGSNDFVKKLFQMLQDENYKDIVKWTDSGDSFVVINTNDFTKDILPRHFKHSNFASFVRQLNKYDFHKVKILNEEKQHYQYGEDAWEFRHPDFRINDRDSLENIKRKGPTAKKISPSSMYGNSQNSNEGLSSASGELASIREELEMMRRTHKSLIVDMLVLQTKYRTVVEGLVGLQNVSERNYRSMGALINTLVQSGIKLPPLDFPNPTLSNLQQPKVFDQSMYQQPVQAPPLHPHRPQHRPQHTSQQPSLSRTPTEDVSPRLPQTLVSAAGSPNIPGSVNSVGNAIATHPPPPATTAGDHNGEVPIVSTTNLPNPKYHVLLVEDDNVCIQLCRKFLVKYGCQVTVVTDGLNAISTVEHTKYDLVLMDIVMPNLDGATATSVIRNFDTKTPIIAMTGNIEDNDLVTYLQNGMSDILAKPFTKDDLYSILSKYLLAPDASTPVSSNMRQLAGIQGPAQQSLILPDGEESVTKMPRLQ